MRSRFYCLKRKMSHRQLKYPVTSAVSFVWSCPCSNFFNHNVACKLDAEPLKKIIILININFTLMLLLIIIYQEDTDYYCNCFHRQKLNRKKNSKAPNKRSGPKRRITGTRFEIIITVQGGNVFRFKRHSSRYIFWIFCGRRAKGNN